MGFLRRLFGGTAGGDASDGDPGGFHFYVRCNRCGEVLHIRANRATDIAEEYDGDDTARVLHKEILGGNCPNLMYVHLTLDGAFQIVETETERCTLVGRQEYEAARQTPPSGG